MHTTLCPVIVALGLSGGLELLAQDPKPTAAGSSPPSAAVATKPKPTQEELEARFKATLTKATMTGRWCIIKEGQLTPEKEDKYTIQEVNKVGGEVWIIRARIQYGKKDLVAPVPVQVKWAGDTPVIVVEDVGVPGSGTYSARVVIHNDTYAGTWSGGEVRGLLSGMITRPKE